jgi:hypothetical protein
MRDGKSEKSDVVENMAPPSENPNHCANCWMPKGSTDWCPHCEAYLRMEEETEQ